MRQQVRLELFSPWLSSRENHFGTAFKEVGLSFVTDKNGEAWQPWVLWDVWGGLAKRPKTGKGRERSGLTREEQTLEKKKKKKKRNKEPSACKQVADSYPSLAMPCAWSLQSMLSAYEILKWFFLCNLTLCLIWVLQGLSTHNWERCCKKSSS